MILTAGAVAAVCLLNFGTAVAGYYAAVRHVDRLLDIEEGSARSLGTTLGGRESDRLGALSAEDIDRIDEWDDDS